MSSHGSESNELPIKWFEQEPKKASAVAVGLVVVGLALTVAALMTDPLRAWRAYTVNWLFFTSISMGAVMLAVMVSMTRGVWSRPIRRIALSFVAFLPVSFVLLIPLLFAADGIFPWTHEALPAGKENYLNVPFFAVRQLVGLGALFVLALAFAYWSLRPDLGLVREQDGGRVGTRFDRLTRGWLGQEAEETRAQRKIAVLGPIICLVYALAFSLVSWDFVMSLEPEWFSTLIGPYFFMGAILGGIAATAILTAAYVRALKVDVVQPSQMHDIGKLTFAFCVFWAYLLFSQFIVIWYGLLPVEQSFVIHRFEPPFTHLAQAVFFCLFVLPFFGLLGVAPKKRTPILATFAGIILVGLWLERLLLVYPSFYTGAERLPIGWQEIGGALLFAGLLLSALLAFATRFPLFQLWQPASELELEGIEAETAAAG